MTIHEFIAEARKLAFANSDDEGCLNHYYYILTYYGELEIHVFPADNEQKHEVALRFNNEPTTVQKLIEKFEGEEIW
jgi:hypothetical protein